MKLLLISYMLLFQVSRVISADGSLFYSSCIKTVLQGWKTLGLALPINRDNENEINWEGIELPIEMGKREETELPGEIGNTPSEESHSGTDSDHVQNATTKLVFDRDASKNGIYHDALEYLSIPADILRSRIRYLLFTKLSKNEYQVMPENGSTIGTNWDSGRKTKILLHGLTTAYRYSAIKNIWLQHIFEIKDEYLDYSNSDRGEYNVVVVDWTSLSTVPLIRYPDAAVATKVAGEDLLEFLMKLKSSGNIRSFDDVHLLGHSLGAHVAGITGRKVLEAEADGNNIINRITGLDPAGPCFDGAAENEDILDKSDAKFVDIIHTNMGNVFHTAAGRYGSVTASGHADFYPNGGEVQLGCNFLEDRVGFCSHKKSVVFYSWSIKKRFLACPCTSWESYGSETCACTKMTGGQYFGEAIDHSARGNYYLPM